MASNLRMPPVNSVQLSGYVATDPQIRYTPTGKKYMRFRIANRRRYRPRGSDEWREATTFLTVVVPGERSVERLDGRLKKGSPVYLEGRIESRDTDSGSRVNIVTRRIFVLERTPVEEVVDEEEPVEEESEKEE